jgi:hypothetical protein
MLPRPALRAPPHADPEAARERNLGLNNRILAGVLLHTWRTRDEACPPTRCVRPQKPFGGRRSQLLAGEGVSTVCVRMCVYMCVCTRTQTYTHSCNGGGCARPRRVLPHAMIMGAGSPRCSRGVRAGSRPRAPTASTRCSSLARSTSIRTCTTPTVRQHRLARRCCRPMGRRAHMRGELQWRSRAWTAGMRGRRCCADGRQL